MMACFILLIALVNHRLAVRMIQIETTNLILRDFRMDDLPTYQTLRDDPKFQRFYSEADSAPEKSEFLLTMFIEQSREVPRTKFQLAVISRTGELIGSCGLRIESPNEASIGCEIDRRWHGSGAAKEAGAAMLVFGFETLKLHRIYAETISENKAAIRLCRALGMQVETEREADCRFKGRSWNTTVMAITALEASDNHNGRIIRSMNR